MYLDLFGSSDRLGGNIGDIISQIIFSIKNNIYIKYDRNYLRVYNSYDQSYNNTIFLQILFDIIDLHNSKIIEEDFTQNVDLAAPTHYTVWVKTLLDIKTDFFTYFKENLYSTEFREKFMEYGKLKNYEIPFDPKKTILVHLRLEDVKGRPDYDGSICANHFKKHIEEGFIPDTTFDTSFRHNHPTYNNQSPLSPYKIKKIIEDILKNKPNHEVIIVTNPGEYVSELPYRYISNTDPCYDLFLLCNSETLILSRSNFAMSSLFFGIGNDVYVPLWGHMVCFGLYTKYDKTNFKYFI
jgi:hypothetical protein